MEGIITIAEVKSGDADIVDLLKMNALLDLRAAMENRAIEESRK